MLQKVGIYNDLSKGLLEKLQKRIEGFGATVRYRFDIERENPDRTFYNGETIFPQTYTLDPTTFKITDKDDAGKPKSVSVAIIKSYEQNDKGGLDIRVGKVRIKASQRGMLRLELDKDEDKEMAMLIELHPKLSGGDFSNPAMHQVITRVDEQAEANSRREERTLRNKATRIAEGMSKKEVVDFCDAMQWDSSQKESVLRDLVEDLAENEPEFFNDLVEGKDLEYRAAIKQALNKGVIGFDPGEYKIFWGGNKMTITVLTPAGEKNEVEKFADWLIAGGEKSDEIFKKIKSLIGATKKKEEAVA